MSQIQINDATGGVHTAALVDDTGQALRSNSLPVTLSTEDLSALVPGSSGTIVVTTNTTAVSGTFSAIQILEDTIFSSLTEIGVSGQSMTGFTLLAGTTIFGRFTAYTLTSGKVRAYS